jgi:hypothetical protein
MRTNEEFTAAILQNSPHIGHMAASTLAVYLMHTRSGTVFTEAQTTAMFNAIKLCACLGLYGEEMDGHSDEWYILQTIMHNVGIPTPSQMIANPVLDEGIRGPD